MRNARARFGFDDSPGALHPIDEQSRSGVAVVIETDLPTETLKLDRTPLR